MILQPVLMPVAIQDATNCRGSQSAQAQMCDARIAERQAARAALAESARLSGIPVQDWLADDEGVPLPTGGYYWSCSHKPGWAAAVAADEPIGIDIEQIRPRKPELLDALATDAEWSLLGDRGWETFFRLWTAKEAALKANSVGIGEFGDCRLAKVGAGGQLVLLYLGREWHIEHYHRDDHVAAVTVYADGVVWNVVEALGS